MKLYEKPIHAKVGGWVDSLMYDAEVTLDGLVWLRVRGSFSSDKRSSMRREDWVLLNPALSISVSWHARPPFSKNTDEKWRGGNGYFATREEAMRHATRHGLRSAYYTLTTKARELNALTVAMHMIERSVCCADGH